MFDLKGYVADIEEVVSASQRPIPDDVYQPEFYYSVLRASILKLPSEWNSNVQRLILTERHPMIAEITEALTLDIEQSHDKLENQLAYEVLKRYAVILSSHEGGMRSAGPA
ncbi:MAG TPA: hypothetical protein VFH43_07685 [Candidatus Kapabacteria bacterium]|nr:hypothetical protein [Candidatus Kapabacteria bacterium]